jgi:hypothetical protein
LTQTGHDGPEASLADEVQHIDEHCALHNPSFHHLMEFTIAQKDHLICCWNALPIAVEGSHQMANTANIRPALIFATDQYIISPFKVWERRQQGLPHLLHDSLYASYFIPRVRTSPFGIGVVNVPDGAFHGLRRRIRDRIQSRPYDALIFQKGRLAHMQM